MRKIIQPIIMFLILIVLTSCSKKHLEFKDQTIDIYLYETYIVEFKNKTNIIYEVLNESILTIDQNTGEVFTYQTGQTDVLITVDNKTITLLFNILEPRILIDNNVLVKYHNDQEFYLNASGIDNKEVVYNSLTPSKVLINDQGRVTSLETGLGIIQVSLKSNKKIFINVTIHVISKLELSVKENSFAIINEFTHQLDYFTTDPFGLTITSNNEDVLTVTNEGIITPLNLGSATVKLMSNYNNEIIEEVEINVISIASFIPVLENTKTNISHNNIVLGATFKSLDKEIFEVDEYGDITPKQKGIAQLEITSLFTGETIKVSVHILNETDYLLALSINNTNQLVNYTFNVAISQIVDQRMIYNSVYLYFDYNKIKFEHINKVEYFVYQDQVQYHYYKDQGINRKEIIEDDVVSSFILTELFYYEDFVYFSESNDYSLLNMESLELFDNLFGNHQIIRLRVKIKANLVDKISFTLLVDDEFIYVDVTYSDIGLTTVEVPNYD